MKTLAWAIIFAMLIYCDTLLQMKHGTEHYPGHETSGKLMLVVCLILLFLTILS